MFLKTIVIMDKVNVEMRRYGFREGKDFVGLMPKLMERVGEEVCAGFSEEIVDAYDVTANGVDSMKVVSPQLIAEE